MRRRRILSSSLSLVLLAGGAVLPSARAQTCDASRARPLFTQGSVLLRDNRFADAVPLFRQSLALCERPETMFNLGFALRGMNRCRDAAQAFESASRIEPDPAQRRSSDEYAREMRACVAHVTVDLRGSPSELLIDGQAASSTATAREYAFDPGHHVFEARLSGYEPVREERDLGLGQRITVSLDVRARPSRATIVVETGDTAALVRIDDAPVAAGRGASEVTPGPHEIEVRYPDAAPQRRTVQSTPGSRVVATFNPPEGTSIVRRWWFWTVIGVAVAGGATAAGLLLSPQTEEPYRGTWWHTDAITLSR